MSQYRYRALRKFATQPNDWRPCSHLHDTPTSAWECGWAPGVYQSVVAIAKGEAVAVQDEEEGVWHDSTAEQRLAALEPILQVAS